MRFLRTHSARVCPPPSPVRGRGCLQGSSCKLGSVFQTRAGVDSGLSKSRAEQLLMIDSAPAVAARLGSGWIADRFGRGTFSMVTGMFLVGSVGVDMLTTHSVTVLTFGGASGWTALSHFAIVASSRGAPAAAIDISAVGPYVGTLVDPPLFGTLASRTSFDVGRCSRRSSRRVQQGS